MSLSKIGRYEIVGTLGKGAMGVVYKATDPNIGRTVALKTTRLDIHGSDAEELLQRFRNEARLAGVLQHPNIVTIYDAGEFEGLFYIAMEYIEGETLHKLLARQKIVPIPQVVELARQVCAGLDAAAAQKVVHRDIKPANIMLEPGGNAKIMDFGIAKSGGGLTSTGQVLGTPNYMSPEQVRGKPLDGRSDLFSFGVILYEMVAGVKPFASDNVTTIIYKIINENPRPAYAVNPAVPHTLSAIIAKALAKSPEQRYQRGADLARDLTNHVSLGINEGTVKVALPAGSSRAAAAPISAKVQAAPEAPSQPSQQASPSEPNLFPTVARPVSAGLTTTVGSRTVPLWIIVAGVVLLLASVAGGILSYVKHSQAQERAELERLLTQQSAPDSKPAVINAGSTASAATPLSPDAGKLAASAAKPSGEIAVSSIPDGAQVLFDGRSDPGWHTPFTASLGAGSHSVAFLMPGYARESRNVQVSAGKQTVLAARLKAQMALAEIISDPPGAAVLVDGSDSGKLTPTQLSLQRGDHNILLRKVGFNDITTSVHLADGQIYHYSNTLQPVGKQSGMSKFKKFFGGGGNKVTVSVQSNPTGAQIMIDGTAQPRSTPAKLSLAPGEHTLSLQLKGYKPLSKTIAVKKDTPLQIDESLGKQ